MAIVIDHLMVYHYLMVTIYCSLQVGCHSQWFMLDSVVNLSHTWLLCITQSLSRESKSIRSNSNSFAISKLLLLEAIVQSHCTKVNTARAYL